MKLIAALATAGLIACVSTGWAQIVSPRPGGQLPPEYFERVAADETAFQFRNAWIQKTQSAKKNRERYLATVRPGGASLSSLPDEQRRSMVVSGTLAVPVFPVKFANTGTAPYPANDLQKELFDGPWPSGTMTELYTEMSVGNFNMTGNVYDWVTLSQNDTYYEGGCMGLCSTAKTGQLILETLTAWDPSVDFGQYDNDGPDGVPNSGDDDGYVDFVSFVHPEVGGECFSGNIWSHHWIVQAWPEFTGPWETNDPRTGGGFIRVQEYTIQPALSCDATMIEIGVFSHEFGHAFGLPDLYDRDGGGLGIGRHGLMGTGNWNTPANPTHMSAWSKVELGWVVPIEVGPVAQPYTINNVNQTGEIYKLDVVEEKFSRKSTNAISGSYSLHCGLTSAEASARNWSGGAGYGNHWDETIRCDFTYDGTSPVTLRYDVSYDMQNAFDFARVRIKVAGTVRSLKNYTATGSVNGETIDLTPHLAGTGVTSYQILAHFHSGGSNSDEDGGFDSGSGGPFILDNISVTGGGENYFADFEETEDGWHYDLNEDPRREFFLVENRSRAGQFDQDLAAEGLYIWHIEENVIHSSLGNTGGTSGTTNLLPAGVMLEEADFQRDLLLGVNSGDAGDSYPGSSNNRTFDNGSNPKSLSHSGLATNVSITGISDPGPTITASMHAGWDPPSVSSISPSQGDQGVVVSVTDITGTGYNYGATFLLRDGGSEYAASAVRWIGRTRLAGELNLVAVTPGFYDVVVRNPDGQETVLSRGFEVKSRVPVFVQSFDAVLRESGVELTWAIWADEEIAGFEILRREAGVTVEEIVNNDGLIARDARVFVDETIEVGTSYEYVLLIVHEAGGETRSQPVRVTTPALALALYQNEPNPFNPSTRIRFLVPEATHVRLVVYDSRGRAVATLLDEDREPGTGEIVWNGRNDSGAAVVSGVYFYRLETPRRVLTRKLILLK